MARNLDRKHVTQRELRKVRVRKVVGRSTRHQVVVFKSNKYTYAQLTAPGTSKVMFSVSSIQEDVQTRIKGEKPKREGAALSAKSEHAARCVGLLLAERCKAEGITTAVFNRNGNLYHGRVKAVADGLREGGLQI